MTRPTAPRRRTAYHANAEGKAADKLFRRFDITDLAFEKHHTSKRL